jgi:hypothetical protein
MNKEEFYAVSEDGRYAVKVNKNIFDTSLAAIPKATILGKEFGFPITNNGLDIFRYKLEDANPYITTEPDGSIFIINLKPVKGDMAALDGISYVYADGWKPVGSGTYEERIAFLEERLNLLESKLRLFVNLNKT